jgi:hypothetical protein
MQDHDDDGHCVGKEHDALRSRFWDSLNGRILLAIVVCIPLTNLLFSPLTCALGWYVIESHQLLQPTNPNFWRVVLGSPSAKRHVIPCLDVHPTTLHFTTSVRDVLLAASCVRPSLALLACLRILSCGTELRLLRNLTGRWRRRKARLRRDGSKRYEGGPGQRLCPGRGRRCIYLYASTDQQLNGGNSDRASRDGPVRNRHGESRLLRI